jgi:phospholipid/cholesterol/gamma-HCH transport system substrate-binding protein
MRIRERNPVIVGIVSLLVLAVIGLATFYSSDLPIIGGGTTYTAYFADASGLTSGDSVRIAGVIVGRVTGVSLDGAKVAVTFRVKNAWVGDRSSAAIKLWTLLGSDYLAIEPAGAVALSPSAPIPLGRTSSPLNVTAALNDVGQDLSQVNDAEVARSLQALSQAFSGTAPDIHRAFTGLADLSSAINAKNTAVIDLLQNASKVSGTLAGQSANFRRLINDGNVLLAQLQNRETEIHDLLIGTQQLSGQLDGLVADDQSKLGPMLTQLNAVTTLLADNQDNLRHALALVGPYYRLLGNALGNGRWFDTYVCGLIPASYLPAGTAPAHGCMAPRT